MAFQPLHWSDKIEQDAKQVLPHAIYDFVAGAADDESVHQRTIQAYQNIELVPRVLKNVSHVDTSLTLGQTLLHSPIIIAPTAPHKLLHPEAELATVRAANQAQALMIVSFMASTSLEQIAAHAKGNLWFQLQILNDRHVTKNLLQRALHAGYKALVLTVDMPVVGNRRRDTYNRFTIPEDCLPVNLLEEKLISSPKDVPLLLRKHTNELFDASVTWQDLLWLRDHCPIPIFLKGILHPGDAQTAIKYGFDGIIVSNHGGRQLGAAIPTIKALPAIKEVVKNKIPLLVDGGIRNGSDIVKALISGASAVLIGRPVLWGLAVGGTAGAAGVLNQLQRELVYTMKICGLPTLPSQAALLRERQL